MTKLFFHFFRYLCVYTLYIVYNVANLLKAKNWEESLILVQKRGKQPHFLHFFIFFAFFLQKVLENKKIAVYLHRQKVTNKHGGFI